MRAIADGSSWHSSLARVFEENVGTTANSSNMVAEYEGPGLTLGNRRGRWIDTRGEYEPNDGTFTVEAVIDGVSQGSHTIPIGAGLSRYGTATYGVSRYGGASRRQWYGYTPGLVPETRSRDFSE
jgi:hypothetical protein